MNVAYNLHCGPVQLFGVVRQALQLVHNKLPGAGFMFKTRIRLFNVSICSLLDV